MMYPIYKEVFELHIIDLNMKFYNMGVLYNYLQLKDGKYTIEIKDIKIMEVE